MSLRASLLKSWVAAKAGPKKCAAMKAAADNRGVPSSRRNPALNFGRIVFPSHYRHCYLLRPLHRLFEPGHSIRINALDLPISRDRARRTKEGEAPAADEP